MRPTGSDARAVAGRGLPLRSTSVPDAMEVFYRGFAGPFMRFDDTLLEYVVAEHAREVVGTFLTLHGAQLDAVSPSLRAFLHAGVTGVIPFERVWSPAFGRAAAMLASSGDSEEIAAVATALGWRFAEQGTRGAWSVALARPLTLHAGRYVLPPATHLAVTSESSRLRLTLGAGPALREYLFRQTSTGWKPYGAEGGLRRNAEVDGVVLLSHGVAEDEGRRYLAPLLLPEGDIGAAVAAHTAAMNVLDRCAPPYARWVRRLLRAVIPLETRTGEINSGSSRDEPGVIHASIDCAVEVYCEMLVHEVSHQTFYTIRRLGPVDDGTDPTLYDSPVKETGRPIAMILLAYHAFANVILLGRQCRRNPLMAGSEYFIRNELHLIPIVARLEEALLATRSLTRIGSALWEPLAAELRRTGGLA